MPALTIVKFRRAAMRGEQGDGMDLGLAGKKALVTGGTKGIGRSIAEHLAREGAAVAICARNPDEVSATVAHLRSMGVAATGRALDVADGAALKAWVADAATELGGLDIVVPNVSALAIANDDAGWKAGFETDMMGTVHAVEAALTYLYESTAGAIVIISSVSGREIDFAAGPYGAFKAALIHYAQGLALNLAPKGIRANSVSPGNTYFPGGVWERIEQHMPDLFARALSLNPTGRMGRPEEMAKAAVFLASPAASFITGTNLVVDGALTRGVQY
jgi:NAD(P)-dependent dehydrogenase (short-subunit alcohol dehydrogenase family)